MLKCVSEHKNGVSKPTKTDRQNEKRKERSLSFFYFPNILQKSLSRRSPALALAASYNTVTTTDRETDRHTHVKIIFYNFRHIR